MSNANDAKQNMIAGYGLPSRTARFSATFGTMVLRRWSTLPTVVVEAIHHGLATWR